MLLFYPVAVAAFETESYRDFADGPWLTKKAMEWFWDAIRPIRRRATAFGQSAEGVGGRIARAASGTGDYRRNDVLRDEVPEEEDLRVAGSQRRHAGGVRGGLRPDQGLLDARRTLSAAGKDVRRRCDSGTGLQHLQLRKAGGHKTDRFDFSTVVPSGTAYWIFENKVVTIPACTRCGGTAEGAPEALLTEDYLCEKCAAALARRGTYLEYSGV